MSILWRVVVALIAFAVIILVSSVVYLCPYVDIRIAHWLGVATFVLNIVAVGYWGFLGIRKTILDNVYHISPLRMYHNGSAKV